MSIQDIAMKLNFESADYFLLFQEQNRHKPTLLPKRNRKAAGKSQEELTLKEALNQKPRPNLCHSCPSISSQQRKVE